MVFWSEFAILYIAALIGAVAVVPYGLRMAAGKPLKFSKPVLYALALAQNAVIFGVAIWLVLLASHSIGLVAPYIEALLAEATFPSATGLIAGLVFGAIAGAVLLIADLFFLPHWPQALRDMALKTTVTDNILASLYGGIDEELLMRMFGFSVLAWLLLFVWHSTTAVFWIANVIMTILFGLGHLPALKGVLHYFAAHARALALTQRARRASLRLAFLDVWHRSRDTRAFFC